MTALITAIVQLLILVFKGWADWDAEKRKKNEELRAGWKEVVKSGDSKRISDFLERLRT